MDKVIMKLKILGARGSVPVEGEQYKIFGGATSSMQLLVSDNDGNTEEIYFDAGSGIVSAEVMRESNISILLTHMHIDHVCGLSFFPALTEKDRRIDIYAAPRNSLEIEAALSRLYSPPFWPVGIKDYPADVHFHGIEKTFMIKNVRVDTLEVNHPGGSTTYKVSYGGKTVVYAADYEHTGKTDMRLADFVKDCDLLIYDGQYTEEEYKVCKGYGHSIPEVGVKIAKLANVKNMIISHHSPAHDDSCLEDWEKKLCMEFPNLSFARIGKEIVI